MTRLVFAVIIYLLAATVVEVACLPPLRDALPNAVAALLYWRLLALAAPLAGLLRGELAGMLTAIGAALLFGLTTDSHHLGPALISFAVVGYTAGRLARLHRLQSFISRWFHLWLLLMIEVLVWGGMRKLFWPAATLGVPWWGILMTAVLGALLFKLVAPSFKRSLLTT